MRGLELWVAQQRIEAEFGIKLAVKTPAAGRFDVFRSRPVDGQTAVVKFVPDLKELRDAELGRIDLRVGAEDLKKRRRPDEDEDPEPGRAKACLNVLKRGDGVKRDGPALGNENWRARWDPSRTYAVARRKTSDIGDAERRVGPDLVSGPRFTRKAVRRRAATLHRGRAASYSSHKTDSRDGGRRRRRRSERKFPQPNLPAAVDCAQRHPLAEKLVPRDRQPPGEQLDPEGRIVHQESA